MTFKKIVKSDRQYIIGMAGHIDHGKTALIQALTGINTDRLKEEQERGITIDLGFAHFSKNVTIIDVPGHERLIKNMVAGVSTIDLVLFVVAADDGIMPQTREHLDIVKLLGIQNGIFVITKIDLVENEWIDLVEEELRNLLAGSVFENSVILRASAVTGEGIEMVRKAILENLSRIPFRRDDGIFRLPIDRVFTRPGFGTVVTGSVLSGSIKPGQNVEIWPTGLTARVRGLQSHDSSVQYVKAGYRAALNLANVGQDEVHRGQVITQPGYYQPVERFNATIQVLEDAPVAIKSQMRLRVHIHTAETFARIIIPEINQLKPGESGFVQFRLEQPIYASFRDRFVFRQYSPQVTLGGGVVLETNPIRYRKKFHVEFVRTLHGFSSENPAERLFAAFSLVEIQPLSFRQIQIKIGLNEADTRNLISKFIAQKSLVHFTHGSEELYYSNDQLSTVLSKIRKILSDYHEQFPGRSGLRVKELVSQLSLQFSENLVEMSVQKGLKDGIIKRNDDWIALPEFESRLTPDQEKKLKTLEELYLSKLFSPPSFEEVKSHITVNEADFKEFLHILSEQGKLVFVNENMVFHVEAVEKALTLLREYFGQKNELRVSEFKGLIGTSRKYALPLLNYFDNKGYTLREGDLRVAGPKLEK